MPSSQLFDVDLTGGELVLKSGGRSSGKGGRARKGVMTRIQHLEFRIQKAENPPGGEGAVVPAGCQAGLGTKLERPGYSKGGFLPDRNRLLPDQRGFLPLNNRLLPDKYRRQPALTAYYRLLPHNVFCAPSGQAELGSKVGAEEPQSHKGTEPSGEDSPPRRRSGCEILREKLRVFWLPEPATRWVPEKSCSLARNVVAFFRDFSRFSAQIRAVFTRFYAFLRVRLFFPSEACIQCGNGVL